MPFDSIDQPETPQPPQPPDQTTDDPNKPLSIWEVAAKAERDFKIPDGLLRGLGQEESYGLNQWDENGNTIASGTGPRGAFQFTKATAREMGINPDDPIQNVIGGAKYLRKNYQALRPLLKDDRDAWMAAAIAHNRGLGAVQSMIKDGVFTPSGVDSGNGGSTLTYATRIAQNWAKNRGSQTTQDQPTAPVPQQDQPTTDTPDPVAALTAQKADAQKRLAAATKLRDKTAIRAEIAGYDKAIAAAQVQQPQTPTIPNNDNPNMPFQIPSANIQDPNPSPRTQDGPQYLESADGTMKLVQMAPNFQQGLQPGQFAMRNSTTDKGPMLIASQNSNGDWTITDPKNPQTAPMPPQGQPNQPSGRQLPPKTVPGHKHEVPKPTATEDEGGPDARGIVGTFSADLSTAPKGQEIDALAVNSLTKAGQKWGITPEEAQAEIEFERKSSQYAVGDTQHRNDVAAAVANGQPVQFAVTGQQIRNIIARRNAVPAFMKGDTPPPSEDAMRFAKGDDTTPPDTSSYDKRLEKGDLPDSDQSILPRMKGDMPPISEKAMRFAKGDIDSTDEIDPKDYYQARGAIKQDLEDEYRRNTGAAVKSPFQLMQMVAEAAFNPTATAYNTGEDVISRAKHLLRGEYGDKPPEISDAQIDAEIKNRQQNAGYYDFIAKRLQPSGANPSYNGVFLSGALKELGNTAYVINSPNSLLYGLGLISKRNFDTWKGVGDAANTLNQKVVEGTGTPGEIVSLAGGAGIMIPRVAGETALFGGNLPGAMAFDAGAQSAGKGESLGKVAYEAGKGYAFGKVFGLGSRLSSMAEKAILSESVLPSAIRTTAAETMAKEGMSAAEINQAAASRLATKGTVEGAAASGAFDSWLLSKVVGEGTRLGTIGLGTAAIEGLAGNAKEENGRLVISGASAKETRDRVIMNLLQDLAFSHGGNLPDVAGKLYRFYFPKSGLPAIREVNASDPLNAGESSVNWADYPDEQPSTVVSVTPEGEVRDHGKDVPDAFVDHAIIVDPKTTIPEIQENAKAAATSEPVNPLESAPIAEKPTSNEVEKPATPTDDNLLDLKPVATVEAEIPAPQSEPESQEITEPKPGDTVTTDKGDGTVKSIKGQKVYIDTPGENGEPKTIMVRKPDVRISDIKGNPTGKPTGFNFAPKAPEAKPAAGNPTAKLSGQKVIVGEKEIELTDAQAKRWNAEIVPEQEASKKRLKEALQSADRYEQKGQRIVASRIRDEAPRRHKGEMMALAAIKREITDQLTDKERANRDKRLSGNYTGKPASVDGRNGKVVGNPFGKVKVEFEDGTRSVHLAENVKAPIEAVNTSIAAHEAATSPKNDLPEPTEAQRDAGNFKMGHIDVNGLPITVEIPTGGIRSGTNAQGVQWSRKMKSHYGYIKRTTGADNENIDVFVKDGTPADFNGNVFVVDQVRPDGSFDEHKVMIGYADKNEAKSAYLSNYAKGWKGLGAIHAMPLESFKAWTADKQSKPLGQTITRQEKIDKAAAPKKRSGPVADHTKDSLSQYVRKSGGIRPGVIDTAALRDADKIASGPRAGKQKAGFAALVRENGRTIEDAFRNAVESGYLPGVDSEYHTGAIPSFTAHDFINAVADDANGVRKHYSIENIDEQELTQEFSEADLAVLTPEADRIAGFLVKPEIINALQKLEKGEELTPDERDEYNQIATYENDLSPEVAKAIADEATARGIREREVSPEAPETQREGLVAGDENGATIYRDEEQEIDETEPEGDVDLSFDFSDDEPVIAKTPENALDDLFAQTLDEETAQPLAAQATPPTDLFSESQGAFFDNGGLFSENGPAPIEAPNFQNLDDRKNRVDQFKADTAKKVEQQVREAYGDRTGAYISNLQSSPSYPKEVRDVADILANTRNLVLDRGEAAKHIVESAADALDAFSALKTSNAFGSIDDVLNQPRLGGNDLSQMAIGFAKSMAAGNFDSVYRDALDNIPREKTSVDQLHADVSQLNDLYGGETLKSGIVPVDRRYEAAKPLFISILRGLPEQTTDVAENMRSLIRFLVREKGMAKETIQKMAPDIKRFISEVQDGTIDLGGKPDVINSGADLEPNSKDAGGQPVGKGESQRNTRSNNSGARPTLFDLANADQRPASDTGVTGDISADIRTQGNSGIQNTESLVNYDNPGGTQSTGGGNFSDTEFQVEPISADGIPDEPSRIVKSEEQKLREQRAAESIPVEKGSLENIAKTLPYLFPSQHEDVKFAEDRFATDKPNQHGVLFTNGTGTGKTFTGLGIVKRHVMSGNSDVLITVPSDKIMSDWIESGQRLGLNISALKDTNDAGKGVTITTYANFGANPELAKRAFKLVVNDESHYLLSNAQGERTNALQQLHAITMHYKEGDFAYGVVRTMREREQFAAVVAEKQAITKEWSAQKQAQKEDPSAIVDPTLKPRWEKLKAQEDALRKELHAKTDAFTNERRAIRLATPQTDMPKTVFLSATPFAYVKTVDYANGYLFNYHEGFDDSRIGAYNAPDPREDFFIRHFGFQMRYGKLTQPEAGVNTALMETDFNQWLKKNKALSQRILDVEADYQRQFIEVDSAIGKKIDEGLKFLKNWKNPDPEFKKLGELLDFTYLQRRYLLEAIKAKEVIPIIQSLLKQGKKVLVYHDYKAGGGFHPFKFPKFGTVSVNYGSGRGFKDVPLKTIVERFERERPDLANLPLDGLLSPLTSLKAAFPEALIFNGDVPKKLRRNNADSFNADHSKTPLMIVQADAGREGISLHDTTGEHGRVLINLGLPVKPTSAIQIEGRIYRIGNVSDAIFGYLTTGTDWEKQAFSQTIASRASTAENLALGVSARSLKDAFITGFFNAEKYSPELLTGKGGKVSDRQSMSASPFERAKSYYFKNQKKTSRNKSEEGVDYFATPEPLGFKMAEWADPRPNDEMLEPSAGHGAIARFFPEFTDAKAIEPSTELNSKLALNADHVKIIQDTFENHNIVNKYNQIVMNPPFGMGGKTSTEHLQKAFTHIRNGGRVVAILPNGGMSEKRIEALMASPAAKGIYTVAKVKLPGVAFKRAGTGVSTTAYVFEKQANPVDAQRLQTYLDRDLSQIDDIHKFFDAIENLDIPPRLTPTEMVAPRPVTKSDLPLETQAVAKAAQNNFKVFEFNHTKTGEPMFAASFIKKHDYSLFQAAETIAKRFGGFYPRYSVKGINKGFYFKDRDARDKFLVAAGELLGDGETLKSGTLPTDQTKTPEFKEWFGDSKVVDESGAPLTVYHGTFNRFDRFETDTQFGAHFGTSAAANDRLDGFPGSNVMPVYLSIQNPLEIADLGDWDDVGMWKEYGKASNEGFAPNREAAGWKTVADVKQSLAAHGYDGVKYENRFEGGQNDYSYIAFEPNQIKSAIGNNGAFSKDSDSILQQARTDESEQALSDIEGADLTELLKVIDPQKSLTRDDYRVEVGNVETFEVIRRAVEQYDIQANPAKTQASTFDGIFLDPRQLAGVTRILTRGARFATKDTDLSLTDRKKLVSIAKTLKDAARAGNGTAIVYFHDDAVPHEEGHKFSFSETAGKLLKDRHGNNLAKMVQHPTLQALKGGAFKALGITKPEQMVEEGFTWLLGGGRERLNAIQRQMGKPEITGDMADEYVTDWIMSFREANPNADLSKFAQINEYATKIYEQINQIEKSREAESQARQESAELSAADSENNQPPGLEESGDSNPLDERSQDDPGRMAPGEGRLSAGRKPASVDFQPTGPEKLSNTPFTARANAIPLSDRLYTSVTNEEQKAFVAKTLDKGVAAAEKWFEAQVEDNVHNNGATTAVGLSLMQKYGNDGDLDNMNRVANTLVPYLTEAGQAIQAVAIISMHDPATAGVYAGKVKMKKTGKAITQEEYDKAVAIAQESQATAAEAGVIQAKLEDLEDRYKDLMEENNWLSGALEKTGKEAERVKLDLTDKAAELKKVKREIEKILEERPPKVRTTQHHAEMLKELRAKQGDMLANIRAKFTTPAGEEISKMATPAEGTPDPDLVDYATLQLLENLPNGTMTPEEFKFDLDTLTNGQLSDQQIDAIHAAAINRIKGSRLPLSPSAKQARKIRSQHYKAAKDFNNVFEKSADKVAKAFIDKIKVGPKVDRFAVEMVKTGVANGFSTEAIMHALATRGQGFDEATRILRHEMPDLSNEEIRQAIRESKSLIDRTKDSIETRQLEKKENIVATEADLAAAREQKRANQARGQRNSSKAQRFYATLTEDNKTLAANTVVSLYRAGLLTGIKTHLRNFTANTAMDVSDEMARPIQALADIVASAKTGVRTSQGPSPAGVARGIMNVFKQDQTLKNINMERGLTEAWSIMKHGDTSEHLAKLQLSESHLSDKIKFAKLGVIADAYINTVFRSMSAEDALFKVYAFRRSLEEQAQTIAKTEHNKDKSVNINERRKELLLNPTNVMQIAAAEFADQLTFQDNNPVTEFTSKIRNHNQVTQVALGLIAPFDRTPTNIILRTLEHTPLGFIKAGYNLNQMRKPGFKQQRKFNNKYREAVENDAQNQEDFNSKPEGERRRIIDDMLKDAFTDKNQREFAKTFGRASLGTMGMALGFVLAATGIVAGALVGAEFYRRKKLGIENRSILIPGVGRFVLPDDPFERAITLGATIYEQGALLEKHKNDAWLANMKSTAGAFYDIAASQPLLENTTQFIDQARKGKFGEIVGSKLGGFVPTLVSDIGEIFDAKQRTGSSYDPTAKPDGSFSGAAYDQWKGLSNQFTKRVPLLRNYLAKEVPEADAMSPEERGGPLRRGVRSMIDITNYRPPANYNAADNTNVKPPTVEQRMRSGEIDKDAANKELEQQVQDGKISQKSAEAQARNLEMSPEVKTATHMSVSTDADFTRLDKLVKSLPADQRAPVFDALWKKYANKIEQPDIKSQAEAKRLGDYLDAQFAAEKKEASKVKNFMAKPLSGDQMQEKLNNADEPPPPRTSPGVSVRWANDRQSPNVKVQTRADDQRDQMNRIERIRSGRILRPR